MPKIIIQYVTCVDYVSTKVGRAAMYLIFVMIGTLLLDAITRNIINIPLSWCVEMAQFTMAAYYILGGAYSMQLGDHVRMDLIYDACSEKNKARLDVVTSGCMLFYLSALLYGSLSSTIYAIETGQRKFSMWNPSMIPIKLIMVFGIVLMLLQAISMLFKDIAKARGEAITHDGEKPDV
ncbi:MAG: TRAP transporter small permease subunit [Rhodospirillales bacterium]|nr:TRAP transporter small permease subunit [Rhodospirillales bacterium]